MGTPGGGARVHEMVKKALEVGYRHFDTADGYSTYIHLELAGGKS
jgi:glycerol 2-dehydrogenase (NADP+)